MLAALRYGVRRGAHCASTGGRAPHRLRGGGVLDYLRVSQEGYKAISALHTTHAQRRGYAIYRYDGMYGINLASASKLVIDPQRRFYAVRQYKYGGTYGVNPANTSKLARETAEKINELMKPISPEHNRYFFKFVWPLLKELGIFSCLIARALDAADSETVMQNISALHELVPDLEGASCTALRNEAMRHLIAHKDGGVIGDDAIQIALEVLSHKTHTALVRGETSYDPDASQVGR